MLRLLCIANPEAYRAGATDVPLGHARLAAHPEVALHHAHTASVLAPGTEIPCVAVPDGFASESFASLSRQPTTRRPAVDFDLVFCRTLKPFPPGYLDRLVVWSERIAFVNDPAGIRRQLEPGFLLTAAESYLPSARLVRDPNELGDAFAAHRTIVVKRANSCGGRGVFRAARDGTGRIETDNVVEGPRSYEDGVAFHAHLVGEDPRPLLAMRYLPRVTRGDKRLVVLDGEIQGAYLRRSTSGHWVQNVSQGARCQRVPVTTSDRDLVGATAGHYGKSGIRLLGYDLIEDDSGAWRISEINAGNVGGLFRLEALGETGLTDRFVRFLVRLADAARARTRQHQPLGDIP